ncbi:sugar isomerase [Planctomonas sp. JC2975]|uniref:polysaccharide lyase 8 family protein n=1 Tax=Planctomonas sp. JC2975 TaxID=2729626 RepID=UPI0014764263|nr:polysaccharide lyase 8 family protein [Planctomonas sp. JC2975]NNC12435.1 sugar isomerase [Planctomonas sp. JC2975]
MHGNETSGVDASAGAFTLSRRSLLMLAGAGALATTLIGTTSGALSASADTADIAVPTLADLIARRATMLIGSGNADEVAALAGTLARISSDATASWSAMTLSAGAPGLWADLPLLGIAAATATGNMGVTFDRVLSLAKAWATKGTAQFGDAQLAEDLVTALTWLSTNSFVAGKAAAGNWWFWEIGVPRDAADTLVLLYDEVPAPVRTSLLAAARYFAPNPNYRGRGTSLAETGANRSDKALNTALRGILDDRTDEIAIARDALSDVTGNSRNSLFAYVTSGDGFYRDGSFVQHTYLPYAGTYGTVTLSGVASILALLGGSTWAVTDPNQSVFLDSIQKTFQPFVVGGRVMDTIRGRAVSREKEPDYVDGATLVACTLLLATGAPAPYQAQFLSLAKGWLQQCTDVDLVGVPTLTIAQALLVAGVLSDDSVQPAPAPVTTQAFGDQDRLVHHRPAWSSVASVSSKRIGRYEWGNDENNLGWYQGDGMLFVYTPQSDPAHFSADFWPTVDPYRLPGTTVNDETRASGAGGAGTGIPRAFQAFAGGLALENRWGVQGMDHLNFDKTLAGKKSWFFLDDGVVCLGAAIAGSGGHDVLTTIENRSYAAGSAPVLRVDHATKKPVAGNAPLAFTGSLHIEGYGGIVLLDAEGVSGTPQVQIVHREGAWYDINSGADTAGSTTVRQRDYVTVTQPHGTDPTSGGYAFLLLPTAAHSTTFSTQAQKPVKVLANTAASQAILDTRTGVTLANFFAVPANAVKGMQVSGPCSVAVHRDGDVVTVALADPSRTQSTATLVLPDTGSFTVQQADDGVTVTGSAPLTLQFALDGHGHAKQIVLTR